MPRMLRALEAHTRSGATAASSSDNDDPSDPHRTQPLAVLQGAQKIIKTGVDILDCLV